MKVFIAKLGTSIQEVEVETGALVLDALKAAGFSLDSVLAVKRSGVSVDMDAALNADDTLLVSQEKIKGGNEVDVEVVADDAIIKIKLDVVYEDSAKANGFVPYLQSQKTFDIVRDHLNRAGYSMNDFKAIQDETGTDVGIGAKLEDGKTYKIILANRDEEEYDED